MSGPGENGSPWWRGAVCYEIYPRSFADSGGDGEGDLEGIRQRLDYLSWLGVDAVWICPFYPSPMADNGYDVSDFCGVDPRFGTLEDFDRLVRDAHARGIRVILDWVPNHSSVKHPWFVDARSSPGSAKRDWYYWRDTPNNWRASFGGGSAWQYDEDSGEYYLHFFLPAQPDLNWGNPRVAAAMTDTMRFWLDRGVDGLRIDSASCLGKDPTFADDPRCLGGQPKASVNDQPRTHEILRDLRRVADAYPGQRVLLGEVDLTLEPSIVRYYGAGDELHLSFNYPPVNAPWDPIVWQAVVRTVDEQLGDAAAEPVWALSTHDSPRTRSRYGTLARVRAAAVMLLTMRGTVFTFQGEELGLLDVDLRPSERRDPGGRDGPRGPIPWTEDPPHGWDGERTWLPFAPEAGRLSVQAQRRDPDSILHLYRRLIGIRRSCPALRYGRWEELTAPPGVFGYRRVLDDERFVVLVNFTRRAKQVELDGAWQVVVDSAAYQGHGDLAPYRGRVEADTALLLAPTGTVAQPG